MKKTQICNYVCIALMAVLLVLQFIPFWSYDGMSTSIQSYIWFPTENAQLTAYLTAQLGEAYTINNIVWMPILVLVAAAVGVIICFLKSDEALTALIPLVCGLIGTWGYLAKPAFQLGGNWMFHLLVCIAMILMSVLALLFAQKNK